MTICELVNSAFLQTFAPHSQFPLVPVSFLRFKLGQRGRGHHPEQFCCLTGTEVPVGSVLAAVVAVVTTQIGAEVAVRMCARHALLDVVRVQVLRGACAVKDSRSVDLACALDVEVRRGGRKRHVKLQ